MNPNDTHPSQMTEEQRAALIASDPSAYDKEEATDTVEEGAGAGTAGGSEGGDGAAAAEGGAAAGEGAAVAGAEAGAVAGGTDAGKDAAAAAGGAATGSDVMIPKARFDEVLGKAKDLERRVNEMEARNKAIEPPAADRDFTKEAADLQATLDAATEELLKKYEDADIELSELQRELNKAQVAYQNGMRDISVAEARHGALSAVHERESKAAIDQASQSWETNVTAWKEANKDFLSNPIRQQAVAGLIESLGADASLSDAELLQKVEEAAFEAFNWKREPGAAAATVVDPHAKRNAADARAAAAASSAPASPGDVGVGARGGPDQAVDVANIKPGDFSKLPKAEQERLLGEGAL